VQALRSPCGLATRGLAYASTGGRSPCRASLLRLPCRAALTTPPTATQRRRQPPAAQRRACAVPRAKLAYCPDPRRIHPAPVIPAPPPVPLSGTAGAPSLGVRSLAGGSLLPLPSGGRGSRRGARAHPAAPIRSPAARPFLPPLPGLRRALRSAAIAAPLRVQAPARAPMLPAGPLRVPLTLRARRRALRCPLSRPSACGSLRSLKLPPGSSLL